MTVTDLLHQHILRMIDARNKHNAAFFQTFRVPLSRYFNNLTGLDTIRLDKDIIKSGDRSIAEVVVERYGEAAKVMLLELISGIDSTPETAPVAPAGPALPAWVAVKVDGRADIVCVKDITGYASIEEAAADSLLMQGANAVKVLGVFPTKHEAGRCSLKPA